MEFLQGKEIAGVGRLCLCMVWVCLFAQLLPPWTSTTAPAPPQNCHSLATWPHQLTSATAITSHHLHHHHGQQLSGHHSQVSVETVQPPARITLADDGARALEEDDCSDEQPTRAYELEHWVLAEVSRHYKNAVYLSREAETSDENAFLTAALALSSHYLLIGLVLWLLFAPEEERTALAEGL
jgi:hypothetical protein